MFLDDDESFEQFLEGAEFINRLLGIGDSTTSGVDAATTVDEWSDVALEEIDLKLIG